MAMWASDNLNLEVACREATQWGMINLRESSVGVVGGEKTKRARRQAAVAADEKKT
jgi:hypothetical protein